MLEPIAMTSTPQRAQTVCLTIGDPTGIGPEIAVKFLLQEVASPFNGARVSSDAHSLERLPLNSTQDAPLNLIVLGDIPQLAREAEKQGVRLPEDARIRYVNLQTSSDEALPKAPGEIAYDSLDAAVAEIHQGRADILVTGPISKENLQAADIPFSGHTEILQALARKYYQKPYQSDMLFLYREFRMLLLTRHVPLRKVAENLSIRGVEQSLGSLARFLKQQCHIETPRLCVLGVNPHAGELDDNNEEERILKPALALVAEKYGCQVSSPVAADAAFRHFNVNQLSYDAYVAAYHDQGLIPFKMVAGLSAVNVTIGLPFLRTSVSHGTAFDIVGQGVADPASLMAAFHTAATLIAPSQAQMSVAATLPQVSHHEIHSTAVPAAQLSWL